MKKEQILERAAQLVTGNRQQDYGDCYNNHAHIADFWTVYLSGRYGLVEPLTAEDAANMMVLLKVARTATTKKRDNFIDMAGYAAIAGECAARDDDTPAETIITFKPDRDDD